MVFFFLCFWEILGYRRKLIVDMLNRRKENKSEFRIFRRFEGEIES